MIEDLIKSVKASLYDRVTSPLFGAVAVSWALWNHRIFVVMLSSKSVEEKFAYIDNVLYGTDLAKFGVLIGFPLLTAALFLFVYPFPAKWVYEFWRKQQKELKKIKQKIEDDTPLTIEESKRVRSQLVEIQADYERQLRHQVEEVERLKQIVAKGQETKEALENELQEKNRSRFSNKQKEESISDQELESILINGQFRLFFNPKRGKQASKTMVFGSGGKIEDGKNMNENTWRVKRGQLELLQTDGKVHSRFRYHPKNQIFLHTDDADTLSIKGQYLVPE